MCVCVNALFCHCVHVRARQRRADRRMRSPPADLASSRRHARVLDRTIDTNDPKSCCCCFQRTRRRFHDNISIGNLLRLYRICSDKYKTGKSIDRNRRASILVVVFNCTPSVGIDRARGFAARSRSRSIPIDERQKPARARLINWDRAGRIRALPFNSVNERRWQTSTGNLWIFRPICSFCCFR